MLINFILKVLSLDSFEIYNWLEIYIIYMLLMPIVTDFN